jgi:hypothetical protein
MAGMKMRRRVFWECSLHEPSCVHVDDHVFYGSGVVLPGFLLLIYYLEHSFQHREVCVGIVDLDAMEGNLYPAAEEDICEDFSFKCEV